jgi:hypothetical protein
MNNEEIENTISRIEDKINEDMNFLSHEILDLQKKVALLEIERIM